MLKILACLTLRFEAEGAEVDRHEKYSISYFSESQFFGIINVPGIIGIEDRNPYTVYNPSIGILDYMPEIFKDIRRRYQIHSSILKNSFFTKENIKKLSRLHSLEGGKSNSFIFNTKNGIFTIKVITDSEVQNFLNLLPDYYKRIKSSSSKLVKIFGLFRILPEKLNILLMQNLIPNRKNYVIFDLKGSQQDRIVTIEKFPIAGIVLKDLNLKETGVKILLNRDTESVMFALKKDFEILQNCQLVDYSIILAIDKSKFRNPDAIFYDERVTIGIIDFLQDYNFYRKAEYAFKLIRAQKNFSMTNPQEYCRRICLFLNEIFEIV